MSLNLISIYKKNTIKNPNHAKIKLLTHKYFVRSLLVIGIGGTRIHELYNCASYFSPKKNGHMPTKEHNTNSTKNIVILSLKDPILLGCSGNTQLTQDLEYLKISIKFGKEELSTTIKLHIDDAT